MDTNREDAVTDAQWAQYNFERDVADVLFEMGRTVERIQLEVTCKVDGISPTERAARVQSIVSEMLSRLDLQQVTLDAVAWQKAEDILDGVGK